MKDIKIHFVDRNDPEWNYMWAVFGKDCEAYNMGESWQYMGTVENTYSKSYWHEFRHRNHAVTHSRMNIKVAASDNWNPTPIR